MKVSELMTKEVRTCTPDTTLAEVARLMGEINVGAIPVAAGGKVEGIITDRDIVLRCVAKGKSCQETKARECMSTDIVTCTPDTDAHRAADTMADRQIRRLPVVENGQLVGIVALGDLATVNIHVNEAGDALSSISFPSRAGAH